MARHNTTRSDVSSSTRRPAVLGARRRRRGSRGDEGQALVEFILVMPLLVALLAGVLEFGWYINAHNTVASAAREAARTVATTGSTATSVVNPVVDEQISGGSLSPSDTSVVATILGGPSSTCAMTTSNAYTLEYAKVTVTYRYHPLFPFLRSGLFLGLDNLLEPNIVSTVRVPVEQEWSPGTGPC